MSGGSDEPSRRPTRPASRLGAPSVGLCATCRHHRVVVSGKGSTFHMCERSKSDARFPKYPPLPVLECVGWEAEAPRPD